jgi:hypothetical protein
MIFLVGTFSLIVTIIVLSHKEDMRKKEEERIKAEQDRIVKEEDDMVFKHNTSDEHDYNLVIFGDCNFGLKKEIEEDVERCSRSPFFSRMTKEEIFYLRTENYFSHRIGLFTKGTLLESGRLLIQSEKCNSGTSYRVPDSFI